MKIPRQFLRTSAVLCLLAFFAETRGATQANPAPPMSPGPTSGPPGQRPAGPSSKMVSTGLTETGGSISNGVYTNSILGFSLSIPPGWPVLPSGDVKPPSAQPGQAPLPQGQPLRRLLVMTENAPLKKSYERKSIQVLAMRLVVAPGPTSARDYLAYSEKTAKERAMPIEYLGTPEEMTVNGRHLWKVALKETTAGAAQHIEQYVTVEGSTLLQFMLVSPDAEGLKSLEPTIQSLHFREVAKATKNRVTKKKQVK